MRGERATLSDIVLQEEPELVNLYCDEEMLEEEEEEEQVQIILDPFRMRVQCGLCDQRIQFYIAANQDSIRQFQTLLLGSLRIICRDCAHNSCCSCNHG